MDEWISDEDLLAELRAALGPAQAPPEVLEAARAVYTWRTVDSELAALSFDSAAAAAAPAGVRGVAALRTLSFRGREVAVEVGVQPDALMGQVAPPSVRSVEVHTVSGEVLTADLDDLGCFSVQPVPTQRFRLVCTTAGGERVVTDWVTL